jgi:23S rRNA (uracil1939-C5)-methyltransferase
MTGCLVPEPEVQAAAEAVAAAAEEAGLPPYDERTRTGLVRHVVARASADGRVLVVVVAAADFPGATALAQAVRARRPAVAGVVLDVNPTRGGTILSGAGRLLGGVDTLPEHVGDLTLELAARAFFQVNRAQAARLYALTADLAAPRAGDLVLDLFSGLGGIALTLARRGARVVGVEAQPEAVAAARRAATAAGLDVDFRTGDVAEVLAEVGAADLAVLDPPRKGCAPAVLARLAALAPRRVVYVSCDPGSLARDLARLGALGLRTTSVQPVDLHPGTPHVEAVAVLERA